MKTRGGYSFATTEHAYGENVFPPPKHALCAQGLGSWAIVDTTFHPRGVTIVWRTQLEEVIQ